MLDNWHLEPSEAPQRPASSISPPGSNAQSRIPHRELERDLLTRFFLFFFFLFVLLLVLLLILLLLVLLLRLPFICYQGDSSICNIHIVVGIHVIVVLHSSSHYFFLVFFVFVFVLVVVFIFVFVLCCILLRCIIRVCLLLCLCRCLLALLILRMIRLVLSNFFSSSCSLCSSSSSFVAPSSLSY